MWITTATKVISCEFSVFSPSSPQLWVFSLQSMLVFALWKLSFNWQLTTHSWLLLTDNWQLITDDYFGLPSSRFARHYFGNLFWFLFLRLLRCFSSAGSPPMTISFTIGWPGLTPAGFPHSEICGSTRICRSPQLIAACHVLLRLLMPRHPPCALSSLTLEFRVGSL